MMKQAEMKWTVAQLVEEMQEGNVTFDNLVQRGFTWDKEKQSLLVHSVLYGFPIPTFFSSSVNGAYDMLDGKQRSNALRSFKENELVLTKVPDLEYVDKASGEISLYELEGKTYDELPEELKKRFDRYSLTINYCEDITDDEACEMFFRLNNGKDLSASERAWATTKSKFEIDRISNHPIFEEVLTAKGYAAKGQRDYIKKLFSVLAQKDICWDVKPLKAFLEHTPIDKEMEDRIVAILDSIKSIHACLQEKNKKVAKKIYSKTHFLALVEMIDKNIREFHYKDDAVANWLIQFFVIDKNGATTSKQYNNACRSGSGHAPMIAKRMEAIRKDWEEYFSNYNKTQEEVVEETIDNVTHIDEAKEVKTYEDLSEMGKQIYNDIPEDFFDDGFGVSDEYEVIDIPAEAV